MKKVIVVMTYFDRPYQLSRTLHSLARSKYSNFEVVIVDDSSNQPPQLGLSSFPITVLRTLRKRWTNPEPAYNIGIQEALNRRADIIVLQNAECYHVNDVIMAAAGVTDETYLSFACFSLDKVNTFRTHDITALLMAHQLGASYDGQCAWYNHPLYRPVAYDFCSAITAANMLQLNGYDERLSDGCGYGDNYLLERIKLLGLKITIPVNPLVVHQWHYTNHTPANKAQLVQRNRLLYAQLLKQGQAKAVHTYTPDLCVSY